MFFFHSGFTRKAVFFEIQAVYKQAQRTRAPRYKKVIHAFCNLLRLGSCVSGSFTSPPLVDAKRGCYVLAGLARAENFFTRSATIFSCGRGANDQSVFPAEVSVFLLLKPRDDNPCAPFSLFVQTAASHEIFAKCIGWCTILPCTS